MNKLQKSYPAPAILNEQGPEKVIAHRAEIAAHHTPAFDSSVYAAKSVKDRLIADQHHKCVYCEQSANGDFGCVEHYRPKGGFTDAMDGKLTQPGYYWLAYDWDNLLFSCSKCNTTFKRNFFALKDPATRNIAGEDIGAEEPLVINPYTCDPGDHIRFDKYIAVPAQDKNGADDLPGKTTIDLFHLNEGALLDRRTKRWEEYASIVMLLKICEKLGNKEGIDITQKTLNNITSEQAEFTGMFKYQQI